MVNYKDLGLVNSREMFKKGNPLFLEEKKASLPHTV